MGQRRLGMGATLILALIGASCATGAPSAVPSSAPSATPMPAASSFAEYAPAFCSAFGALFLAVGNPDTAAGSVLSKGLDAAVAAHDGPAADRLAAEITTELESGRKSVAQGGGWAPAAPMMAQLDRVFVAFEAMTAAKRSVANQAPNAVEPQIAFEQAGGAEAWTAMLTAWPTIKERPAGQQPCANLPISP